VPFTTLYSDGFDMGKKVQLVVIGS